MITDKTNHLVKKNCQATLRRRQASRKADLLRRVFPDDLCLDVFLEFWKKAKFI